MIVDGVVKSFFIYFSDIGSILYRRPHPRLGGIYLAFNQADDAESVGWNKTARLNFVAYWYCPNISKGAVTMKKNRRLSHHILMVLVVSLALAPISQAA